MLAARALVRPCSRSLVALSRAVHTEKRIASLGYSLPELPQPAGAYKLAVRQGNWVYTAGHLPFKEDMKTVHVGRVGVEFTAEQGSDLAKITGLELIASLKGVVGDLDKVKRIVKVNGYIACPDTFTALPAVVSADALEPAARRTILPAHRVPRALSPPQLNGCSNLLGEVFEDRGVHARAAVGVTSLPCARPPGAAVDWGGSCTCARG